MEYRYVYFAIGKQNWEYSTEGSKAPLGSVPAKAIRIAFNPTNGAAYITIELPDRENPLIFDLTPSVQLIARR